VHGDCVPQLLWQWLHGFLITINQNWFSIFFLSSDGTVQNCDSLMTVSHEAVAILTEQYMNHCPFHNLEVSQDSLSAISYVYICNTNFSFLCMCTKHLISIKILWKEYCELGGETMSRTDTGTCMEQCKEESSTYVSYMHTVLRLFPRGVTMHDKGGFVCPPCSLSSVTLRGVLGGDLLILHVGKLVHSLCRLSSISNTSTTIPAHLYSL